MAFRPTFAYNPLPAANYGSLAFITQQAEEEQVVGCWSWRTFLAPLMDIDLKLQTSSRKIRVERLAEKSLVERFSDELLQQHSEKSDERDMKVFNAKRVLQNLLLPLQPLPPFPTIAGLVQPDPFKVLEENWKHYESALKIKSDRESSGSTWTIDMLERYIRHQDIVFVQPENRLDLTAEALQRICERVDMSIKAICGSSPEATVANLGQLHSLPNTILESDIRMILDAILQPLCVYKGLTIRSEQTITCNELPGNRYDFILYFDNAPVGVVEAKRQGCLNDKSVAQLLVQLLLLSAEEPDRFYFGVLSDSCRYIFAGVSRQKVVFFQSQGTFLEIATVKSEQDLANIACKISWLADLAIRSIARQKSIEDFLAPVTCLKIKDSFLNEVD